MATFQVSPGVNVKEVDLTTIIPAVSTTTAGIAAHLRWGPVEQRVLVDSENTLVQQFNKPNSNTAVDFFTAANFLSYSSGLYVVRVIDSTTGTAGRNAHGNVANNTSTIIKNDDDYNANYSSGLSGVGQWVAKYPGELGNSLKVSVCPSANAWQSTLTGNIAITSNTTSVSGTGTLFQTEVTVGDLIVVGPDRTMVKVASIASNTSMTLTSRYTGNTVTVGQGGSTTRRWEYYQNFDVAPGTSDFVSTAGGSGDELHVVVIDEDGQFSGVKGQIIEKFEKVSFASDALTDEGLTNYYKNVINQKSVYIWWAGHNSTNGNAGRGSTATFGGEGKPQTVSLVNGRDGAQPTNGDYIRGYNLFASADDVDISFILGAGANQTRALHLINNIAEVRKDCLACLSPRQSDVVNNAGYAGSEAEDIVAFRNLLPSSSYAVMDSNWKYQYDRYNDVFRYIPCNGDTAGLMVQTDLTRDPWWSPAGFNRGNVKNVIKLAFNPNKDERDVLYKAGVNPIVSFPGQGTVLFGDKTMLSKPSAFDRINVRRLFIVLEKAISTAAKFTLFEFNDEFTRAQFRNMVEPFLRDIQGRRGITDFLVRCDETNNTPQVIDTNRFVGDILVKPARSINWIDLNFVAVGTGVEFSEKTGQF